MRIASLQEHNFRIILNHRALILTVKIAKPRLRLFASFSGVTGERS